MAPTGRWWPAVRLSVLPLSVVSVRKVACASGLEMESSETVSVVKAPSAVAAGGGSMTEAAAAPLAVAADPLGKEELGAHVAQGWAQ